MSLTARNSWQDRVQGLSAVGGQWQLGVAVDLAALEATSDFKSNRLHGLIAFGWVLVGYAKRYPRAAAVLARHCCPSGG